MNRNIGIAILLSIVTCGIYGIYWFYVMTQDINELSGDTSINPGLAILLSIVTCGIYFIYWAYKMAKLINQAELSRGMVSSDDSVLYVVLSVFGLGIVVYALLQSRINNMVPAVN